MELHKRARCFAHSLHAFLFLIIYTVNALISFSLSRSNSEMELIARQIIAKEEGETVAREILEDYCNPDSDRYHAMVQGICKKMGFTSLAFNRLDDMIKAVGIDPDKLCTYCWNGKD